MTDLLNQLVTFIGENPTLANAVVFLIAMGEALFLIGMVVLLACAFVPIDPIDAIDVSSAQLRRSCVEPAGQGSKS